MLCALRRLEWQTFVRSAGDLPTNSKLIRERSITSLISYGTSPRFIFGPALDTTSKDNDQILFFIPRVPYPLPACLSTRCEFARNLLHG